MKNMKKTILFSVVALVIAAVASVGAAQLAKKPSAEGAVVYIVAPADGDTVPQTFTVTFGLKGMGVAPAGVDHANTGHHHLLVDVAELPSFDAPLAATDNIRHFGAGQTEAELTLPPGTHTLQLVLADYLHTPHEVPLVSEKITVTVR